MSLLTVKSDVLSVKQQETHWLLANCNSCDWMGTSAFFLLLHVNSRNIAQQLQNYCKLNPYLVKPAKFILYNVVDQVLMYRKHNYASHNGEWTCPLP